MGDLDEPVRAWVSTNPATPRAMLWAARVTSDSTCLSREPRISGYIRLRADELPAMWASGPWCRALAAASAVDPGQLGSAAEDPDPWVRQAVARNPATPVEVLHRLAGDPNRAVRESTGRFQADARVLLRLAADPEPGVRTSVAANPAFEEVASFLGDPDRDVVVAAMRNPRLPRERLDAILMATPPERMEIELWKRATELSDEAWSEFSRQDLPAVRVAAFAPARIAAALVHSPPSGVLHQLVGRDDLPPEALSALSRSSDVWVRRRVAAKEGLPAADLALLASDPDVEVRHEVAKNLAISVELAERLLADPDERARSGLAWNRRHAAALGPRLARDPALVLSLAWSPFTAPEVLRVLLPVRKVRAQLARHRLLPPECLGELARDPDVNVRCAVAIRDALPSEIVDVLLQDPHPTVRAWLAGNRGVDPSALFADPSPDVRCAALATAISREGERRRAERAEALGKSTLTG